MNWPFVILAACVAAAFGVPLYIVVNRRPPPPQHLSDSAGSAQFAAQAQEAEARGRR